MSDIDQQSQAPDKAPDKASDQATARFVRSAALMVASSALLAGVSLLAKALGRGVGGTPLNPMQITAGRFFFAFAVIVLAALRFRPDFHEPAWGRHVWRTVLGWLAATCTFAAAARMQLAEATAISFLSPVATMALAIPFLRERVGPVRWLAAAICVAGAFILIRPGSAAFQPVALIALASALLLGMESILIKKLITSEPPMRVLLINNGIGVVISIAVALVVWQPMTGAQWAMLATLGIAMACAQFLLLLAMRGADAAYVAPFIYAALIFAALYDVLLFGDWPDAISRVGMGVIVLGGVLMALRGGPQRN